MGLLSRSADTFYAFRFLRLLTTKWTDTGAFELGLIDKNGKIIRNPKNSKERSKYNIFHRLVFNIKRLINKVPLGRSTIASYLTALYLIKEKTGISEEEILSVINEAYDTDISISDLLFESEEIEYLNEGEYVLNKDVALPFTGELLAKKGTRILAETLLSQTDSIFGYPVFDVFHQSTKSKIKITKHDIEL